MNTLINTLNSMQLIKKTVVTVSALTTLGQEMNRTYFTAPESTVSTTQLATLAY